MPLEPIRVGEPLDRARLRILINEMIECIEQNKQGVSRSDGNIGATSLRIPQILTNDDPTCLDVVNTCGCSFNPGDIVELDSSAYPYPDINSNGQGSSELPPPAYSLKFPTGESPCFFGVLCKSIEDQCSAKNAVKVCGLARVRICINDEDHTHAIPVKDEKNYLETHDKPFGARIKFVEDGDGKFRWAWVWISDCYSGVQCAEFRQISGDEDASPPNYIYDVYDINGNLIIEDFDPGSIVETEDLRKEGTKKKCAATTGFVNCVVNDEGEYVWRVCRLFEEDAPCECGLPGEVLEGTVVNETAPGAEGLVNVDGFPDPKRFENRCDEDTGVTLEPGDRIDVIIDPCCDLFFLSCDADDDLLYFCICGQVFCVSAEALIDEGSFDMLVEDCWCLHGQPQPHTVSASIETQPDGTQQIRFTVDNDNQGSVVGPLPNLIEKADGENCAEVTVSASSANCFPDLTINYGCDPSCIKNCREEILDCRCMVWVCLFGFRFQFNIYEGINIVLPNAYCCPEDSATGEEPMLSDVRLDISYSGMECQDGMLDIKVTLCGQTLDLSASQPLDAIVPLEIPPNYCKTFGFANPSGGDLEGELQIGKNQSGCLSCGPADLEDCCGEDEDVGYCCCPNEDGTGTCVKSTRQMCQKVGGTFHETLEQCESACNDDPMVWCCPSAGGPCTQVAAGECEGAEYATEAECNAECDDPPDTCCIFRCNPDTDECERMDWPCDDDPPPGWQKLDCPCDEVTDCQVCCAPATPASVAANAGQSFTANGSLCFNQLNGTVFEARASGTNIGIPGGGLFVRQIADAGTLPTVVGIRTINFGASSSLEIFGTTACGSQTARATINAGGGVIGSFNVLARTTITNATILNETTCLGRIDFDCVITGTVQVVGPAGTVDNGSINYSVSGSQSVSGGCNDTGIGLSAAAIIGFDQAEASAISGGGGFNDQAACSSSNLVAEMIQIDGGPGTELQSRFKAFGAPKCQRCSRTAKKMDDNGAVWCREHFEDLVSEIQSNVQKAKGLRAALIRQLAKSNAIVKARTGAENFEELIRKELDESISKYE